jgi:hypothetical protein
MRRCLVLPDRAEQARGGGVDGEDDGELAFLDESFDEGLAGAGGDVPVDERMSSPGSYSRTSANSMPLPRKAEWYSPANRSSNASRADLEAFDFFA